MVLLRGTVEGEEGDTVGGTDRKLVQGGRLAAPLSSLFYRQPAAGKGPTCAPNTPAGARPTCWLLVHRGQVGKAGPRNCAQGFPPAGLHAAGDCAGAWHTHCAMGAQRA